MAKKYFRIIAKPLYTLLGTFGVYYFILSSTEATLTLANLSILPSIIILFYYWKNIFKPESSSKTIFHFCFSVLLSCILIIGGQLNVYSQISWSISTIIKITFGTFAVFPLINLTDAILSKSLASKNFTIKRKHKLIAFLVPFTACFIAWLIFLPGIYTYDMASWNEMLSTGHISSHWSIAYGYLLAGFLDLGYSLFNNYEIGFAIAMLAQLLFISYVLYRIIIFVTSISKNKYFFYGSLLFFILTPFIIIMSITDAQDVIFGGLMALLTIELYSWLFRPDHTNKASIIKLILLPFLLTIFRNNGIICILLCILLILFIKTPKKTTILFSLCGALVLHFIYTGPIYQILNVQKNNTSIQEILGIPSQQLARSYYQKPSSFSEEETAQLKEFYTIDNSSFSQYQSYPLISDFTKSTLDSDYTKENFGNYISLYTKIGLKNPGNYIEAFLLNSIGFWYPMKNYNDPRINLKYMNYPGFTMTAEFNNRTAHPNMKKVSQIFPNNPLQHTIENIIFNNGWYNIPIIAQLCSIGLYTIIALYTAFKLLVAKSFKLFAVLSPAIGLVLTLFVAPVAIYRYAFPIALLIPVFILFASIVKINNKPKTAR